MRKRVDVSWILLLTWLGGCGDDGVEGQPGGAGGTNPEGGAGDLGGAVVGGAGGAGGAPAWVQEPWAAFCPVERALAPEIASPSLAWEPCASGVGCERLVDGWSRAGAAWSTPTFSGTNADERSGIHVRFGDGSSIAATFDANGLPTNVWRAPMTCALSTPVVDADGFWFGVENYVLEAWYIRSTWAGFVEPLGLKLGYTTEQRAGTPDLFFMQREGGGLAVWDHAKGDVFDFDAAADASFSPPGAEALAVLNRDGATADGWVWDRTTGAFSQVAVAGAALASIHSDAAGNLVWVTMGGSPELYRGLVTGGAPILVGALPGWAEGDRIGDGRYATASGSEVLVVRLEDGVSEAIPLPPGEAFAAIAHLSASTIVIQTDGGIYRWSFTL